MRRPLMALCLTAVVGLATAPAALAAPTPVTPLAPTVIDECGVGGDRVVIPQVDGVRYLAEVAATVRGWHEETHRLAEAARRVQRIEAVTAEVRSSRGSSQSSSHLRERDPLSRQSA